MQSQYPLKTMDKKSFKEKYPNLYKELESGENKVAINSVCTDTEAAEKSFSDKLRNFDPTVVDFIRRCDTEEQAEEIITYLQRKGEITEKNAGELLGQLKRDGVRSFGTKKEENYYFKEGGI